MLPELNYIQILRRTEFPFFVLSSKELRFEDGLVLLNEKVVDDRNQPGKTLGQRRLHSPHKLFPIRKCVKNFIELLDSKDKSFIDSRGNTFTYIKTKTVTVRSYEILKKISKETFTVIVCKNVNSFFAVPRFPRSAEWAQIIELDTLPWKLYSTSDDYIAVRKRMV
jgi:hypothetical protein